MDFTLTKSQPKTIKLSEYFAFIKPKYVYVKLTPNNSIRNTNTHKLATTISSLYKSIWHNIKREREKIIKVMGKEFAVGTKYSYTVPCKVSYYIYIENQNVEFYFILPEQHLSIIKEKISDIWSSVTVDLVSEIPRFSEESLKYQLVYKKEDALSLASDRRDNDLLNSNLNIVDVLEEDDKVGLFYNFIPTGQFSWRSTYKNTIRKVESRLPVDRDKTGLAFIFKLFGSLIFSTFKSLNEAFSDFSGEDSKKKENSLVEKLVVKLNKDTLLSPSTIKKGSSMILNTQIIVLSDSKDSLRKRNNAISLAQSFDTISDDNRLIHRKISNKKSFNPNDFMIKELK